MRNNLHVGTLLRKRRREHKGDTFTLSNIVETRKENVYIIICYRTGKTKALRHSSLSDYRIV